MCNVFVCVLSLTSPWLPSDQSSVPPSSQSASQPVSQPVEGKEGKMETDCDFYLSGLSGTVLEIVTTWKALVGFRRKDKDEKAVLLGLF